MPPAGRQAGATAHTRERWAVCKETELQHESIDFN